MKMIKEERVKFNYAGQEHLVNCRIKPGDGPIVVFIHGNSRDLHSFDRQLIHPGLEKFHAISFDLPGHGNSSHFNDPSLYGPRALGLLVAEFLEHLVDDRELILVGHDLGGHIAIQALLNIHVDKILISGCAPINNYDDREFAFLPNQNAIGIYREDFSEKEAMDYLLECLGEQELISYDQVKTILNTDFRFKTGLMNALAENQLTPEIDILKDFDGEIAIILGELDSIVHIDFVKAIELDSLFHDEVILIPESPHDVHIVGHKYYNSVLHDFLGTKSGSNLLKTSQTEYNAFISQ